MRMALLFLLSGLAALAPGGDSARILAFLPFPGKSHHMFFDPVVRGLTARGHHVYAIKGIPLSNPPKENYTEVVPPNMVEKMFQDMDIISFGKMGPVEQHFALCEIGLLLTEGFLSNENVQRLIQSDLSFDLMLSEAFFVQEATAAIAHRFSAPHVVLVPLGNNHWTNHLMDNPHNPSYVPDFRVTVTDKMTLWQRAMNLYASITSIVISHLIYIPKHQALVDKYLNHSRSNERPPLKKILGATDLALQNAHYSLNGAAPNAPNLINVGGLHINPNKPLPKKLKEWMDGADDGVIYFSFGSVLPPQQLQNDVKQAFVSAFGKIKQRVIWKYDGPVESLPRNVYTDKWLPQQDILAHKNCKLFITHGGYLSISEAVNYGVPLVGTPFFGDQQKNLWGVVQGGYGIQLDYPNITDESVLWAITEVLNNPSYSKRMAEVSSLFRDRALPPLDEALFWLEHVLRHGGSPHLRPAASLLTWWQVALLDLSLLFAVEVALVGLVLWFVVAKLRCFAKKVFGKLVKTDGDSQKKNK